MKRIELKGTLVARFWSKVLRGPGCWVWLGRRTKKGYGQLNRLDRYLYAHRLSFTIAHGDPGESMVCHHCDNPICVRPDHLYAGSAKTNVADMVARGRCGQKALTRRDRRTARHRHAAECDARIDALVRAQDP